jgi:hypothetical protein
LPQYQLHSHILVNRDNYPLDKAHLIPRLLSDHSVRKRAGILNANQSATYLKKA